MTHHASSNPRRVAPKPAEKGASHTAVHHERRHKSMEGRYGVIGAGATLTDTTYQTTDNGGDPTNYYPGIVLSPTGLNAYNSGGTVTMTISAADGSVTVTGAGTITGAVIQTSASNPRTVMNSSGIQSYDNLGNQTFNLGGGQLTVSGQSLITGGTIRTSASNPRVEMNTNGLYVYNSAGTQTALISSIDGSVTISGNLTVTGTSTITGGTFQTATTNPRMVVNSSGINAYSASGSNTFTLDTSGNLTVQGATATITGATVQTSSGGSSRVVMDSTGLRAYDSLGNNTFNLTTSGNLSLYMGAASSAAITLGSAVGGSTGARVVLDPLGIHAYDASNTRRVNIDATSGLITATGVITANPGSTVPWQTTGFFVGGGNLLSNASAEDPTSLTQYLYMTTGSNVTAGTFVLQFSGQTATSAIAYNATAAQVQTALQATGVLPAGVSVSCSGGPLPGGPVVLTFTVTGTSNPTVSTPTATSSLTGGTATVGPQPQGWTTIQGVLDWIATGGAFHGGQVFRLTGQQASPSISQTVGPLGLVAGTSYTLSGYFQAPTATRPAQFVLTWLDSFGNTISTVSATSSWSTSTVWQRLISTASVPASATRQQIAITGSPTAGTFKLIYNGQTTAAINWNATAAQVLSALQGLSNVGSSGAAYATGGPLPGTPVVVSFVSPPAAAPTALTFTNLLTGGTSPTLVISNQPAISATVTVNIPSGAAGEVFYGDALQLEVGDAPTGFKPRPDEILANTIQANMINVAQLSAISANLGSITAGTITGAVVRSNASNPRMEMNSSGVYGYDSGGNQTVALGGSTNTITGATIQTASSGNRVVLSGSSDAIQVFNTTVSSTVPTIQIDPVAGISLTGTNTGAFNAVDWFSANTQGTLIGSISAWNSSTTNAESQWYCVNTASAPNSNGITLNSGTNADNANSVQVNVRSANRVNNFVRTVLDGAGASSFLQLASIQKGVISGPYDVTLAVPGNGSQSFTITDASLNLVKGKFVVDGTLWNGAWLDHCSWCVLSNTGTSVTISVANLQANAASGDFFASIISWN